MKNFGNKNKNVVKRQSTELATVDFEDLAGDGLDDLSTKVLPRAALRILNANSPAVMKKSDQYVEGAEPGMIINTSNNQIYSGEKDDEQIAIVICKFRNLEIEWRQGRQGFVKEHLPGSEITKGVEEVEIEKKIVRLTQNEIQGERTLLVDTAIFYCLVFLQGSLEPIEVAIDMSSSNWTTAKGLNGHYDGIRFESLKEKGKLYRPPRYALTYQLFSSWKENDKGSWFAWGWKPLGRLHPSPQDPKHNERDAEIVRRAVEYKNKVENDENLEFDYRRTEA
jgi:hypothetical protein